MIRFSTVIILLAFVLSACDSEGIDRVVVQQTNAPVAPTTNSSGGSPSTETTPVADVSTDTSMQSDADSQSDNGSPNTDNITQPVDNARPIVVPPPAGDIGQSSTPAQPVVAVDTDTQDASSNANDNANDNNINMFGGSGSSDGGQSGAGQDNQDANAETENNTDTETDNGNTDSNNSNADVDNGNNTDTPTETVSDSGNSTPANDVEDTSLSLQAPTSGTTFVSTTSPVRYGGPECSHPNKDENDNLIFDGSCPTVKRAGNVAFGDFLLANNTWNDCASAFANWTQCISVDDSSGKVKARWDYDWGNESDVRGAVWLVKSYPEVIYGVKSPGEYSASTLAQTVVATGLPAKVSDLPFYKISYTASSDEYPTRSKVHNGQTINGERNIAVESFFHELGGDCDVNTLVRNGTTSNQRFELMVWVDAGAERLPAAPNDYVTTTSIDGQQYDVYTKPSDREYIAFVAKTSRSSADLNWNSFIEWSREYSHRVNEVFGRGANTVQIQDSWCLANILLGTEIWWGNGFFQLDDYTIQRTER